ncbi:glycosyltransferase [Thalassobellus sediminis]|uniref:glycosyltransferase n=1 Tax=Thalassobellus sediminis TaxID=3367753 RepID=UPI0037AC0AA1
MKLSIIIPAYNSEKHIENCIKNIYNQKLNLNDFEIIIVNDGSTDDTKKVVEDLKERYFNIKLVNQNNQGSSVARNHGIGYAKGDYIYFLDSDDYLANKTLSIVLKMALKFKPDIITFDALRTNKLNLTECKNKQINSKNLNLICGKKYLELYPEHRFEIWWYIINREFLLTTGINFKEGVFHQDVIFTLSLFMEAKKTIKLDLDVYRYYQSEGSSIRNKKPSHLKKIIDDYLILFEDIELFIEKIKIMYPVMNKTIIENIRKRRDRDSFFMIIRMIRAKFSIKNFDKYLNKLNKCGCYPIPYNAVDNQTNKLKFYTMVFMFNHKITIYLILFIYKLIK